MRMELYVSYKDSSGGILDIPKTISTIALAKHMAIAGQGYMPHIGKFFRVLGMFLRFKDYMDYRSIKENRFSIPQDYAYDPTEMVQFSNVIGKAFADYLVKEIDFAKLTFNYEAAMRLQNMQIKGTRPDLLCVCQDGKQIAVEAKGRKNSKISVNEMQKYKSQAQNGPIPVNSAVASVAYNLYDKVEVKYYDPESEYFDRDESFLKKLIKAYYGGLCTYLNEHVFNINTKNIGERKYYVLNFNGIYDISKFNRTHCFICYERPIAILLDSDIKKFAESGEVDFSMGKVDENNLYIDSDGVGMMFY